MELPSTKMGKTIEGIVGKKGCKLLFLGQIWFEISVRHPSGNVH